MPPGTGLAATPHPTHRFASLPYIQLLVQRFEGLLDRILRAKAWTGGTGGSGAAKGGSGGGGKGGGAPEPDLALSLRSLGTSFWALGNMQYPLAQEQLDKIAGGFSLTVYGFTLFQAAQAGGALCEGHDASNQQR